MIHANVPAVLANISCAPSMQMLKNILQLHKNSFDLADCLKESQGLPGVQNIF